jgi:membrane protease YdiL (CAAX protease family)
MAAVLQVCVQVTGILILAGRHLAALFRRSVWTFPRTLAWTLALVIVPSTVWYAALMIFRDLPPTGMSAVVRTVVHQNGIALSLLYLAVFVPLSEELAFRGVILSGFRTRLSPTMANVAQAALFGALHAHPLHSVTTFVFGLGAGMAAMRSRSLVAGLLAHMTMNATACGMVWAWYG